MTSPFSKWVLPTSRKRKDMKKKDNNNLKCEITEATKIMCSCTTASLVADFKYRFMGALKK